MSSTFIYIKSQFTGYHRWKDAPDDVDFLRDFHRHVFHVTLTMPVTHSNRDIEFFQLKRQLDSYLHAVYADNRFEQSCEAIALDILVFFKAQSCEVSEDGENGAIVYRSRASQEIKRAPFLGTELEGPNKGAQVLFVPAMGPDLLSMATACMQVCGPVSRLYWGAGNNRVPAQVLEFDLNPIFVFLRKHNLKLDVELVQTKALLGLLDAVQKHSAADVLGNVIIFCPEAALSVLSKDHSLYDRVMHKRIIDSEVIWRSVSTGEEWKTWLYHPDFALDRTIHLVRG